MKKDKSKKLALIVGGTSGVGKSLLFPLVKNNYQVVFLGTNVLRGQSIETELNQTIPDSAEFIALDLTELTAVKEFVSAFKVRFQSLNLLVNTAGVLLPKRQENSVGLENSLTIAYLSTIVLTLGLMPLLIQSSESKILNVAGEPRHVLKQRLDFSNFQSAIQYSGFKAAINAVHAKTVFTEILHDGFFPSGICVCSFHPGIVKSNLTQNFPPLIRVLSKFMMSIFPNKSQTGIRLCLAGNNELKSGHLYKGLKAIPISFSDTYKSDLWNASIPLIRKQIPNFNNVLEEYF